MSKEMNEKLDKLLDGVHSIDKRLVKVETIIKIDEDQEPRIRKVENKVLGTQIAFGIIMGLIALATGISKLLP